MIYSSNMRLAFCLLLCLGAHGATLLRLSAGGQGGADPAGNIWTPDTPYVTGGAAYPVPLTDIPYRTLRYTATAMSWAIPEPSGAYVIKLGFLEPRTATTVPTAGGVGLRVFAVAVNGTVVSPALDLFKAPGPMMPYSMTVPVTVTDGKISIVVTAAIGNAVLSWIEVDSVDAPPPPPSGIQIQCSGGVVSSTVLTAAAANQEIPILPGISGNFRFDQVTVSETTQFAGATGLTVSMGRPGTNNSETTGALVPLMVSSGGTNFWQARATSPQLSGTYSLVLNFAVTSGNVKDATGGALTWEVCGYNSPLPLVAQIYSGVGVFPAVNGKPAYGMLLLPDGSWAPMPMQPLQVATTPPGAVGMYRVRLTRPDGSKLVIVGTDGITNDGEGPGITWETAK